MGKPRLTTEIFVQRARAKHGNRYDYSKSIYVSLKNEITIICPAHGKFKQRAENHMHGRGCAKCYAEAPKNYRYDTESFIAKAREVHGDKYDYSKTKYVAYTKPVTIICPIHGEFTQTAANHIFGQGKGCKRCASTNTAEAYRMETIPNRIKKIEKQTGVKVYYSGQKLLEPVPVKCKKHGMQSTRVHRILMGNTCRECSLEERLGEVREQYAAEFETKARAVHGDKYDYRDVVYVKATKRVMLHCPEHGKFTITPNYHLRGHGCRACMKAFARVRVARRYFYVRSKAEHSALLWISQNSNWDFSKLEEQNSEHKITIRFGKNRTGFIPDFVYKGKRLVEVKSPESFGLYGRFYAKTPNQLIREIQAKVKAAKAEGFECTVLVMRSDGSRIRLPKNWEHMKPDELRREVGQRSIK